MEGPFYLDGVQMDGWMGSSTILSLINRFRLNTLVVVGDSISDMVFGDGLRPGNNQETLDYFESQGYVINIDSHAVSGADFRTSATDRRSIQLQVDDVITQYAGQSGIGVLMTIGTNEYGGPSPENDWANWDQARKDAYTAILEQMCVDITEAGFELIMTTIPYRRGAGEELRVQFQNEELYYPLIEQYSPAFWDSRTSTPILDYYQFTLDFGTTWYSDLLHPSDDVGTPATRAWFLERLKKAAIMPRAAVQTQEPEPEPEPEPTSLWHVDTLNNDYAVSIPDITFTDDYVISFTFEWVVPSGGPDVFIGNDTGNTDTIYVDPSSRLFVKHNNVTHVNGFNISSFVTAGSTHDMVVRKTSGTITVEIDGQDIGVSVTSSEATTFNMINGNNFGLWYRGRIQDVSFSGTGVVDRFYSMSEDNTQGNIVIDSGTGAQNGQWYSGTTNNSSWLLLDDATVNAARTE